MIVWKNMSTAPTDRDIIVWCQKQQCARVVLWMTAIEDGTGNWIYARKLQHEEPEPGLAMAFHVSEPLAWTECPDAPVEEF